MLFHLLLLVGLVDGLRLLGAGSLVLLNHGAVLLVCQDRPETSSQAVANLLFGIQILAQSILGDRRTVVKELAQVRLDVAVQTGADPVDARQALRLVGTELVDLCYLLLASLLMISGRTDLIPSRVNQIVLLEHRRAGVDRAQQGRRALVRELTQVAPFPVGRWRLLI